MSVARQGFSWVLVTSRARAALQGGTWGGQPGWGQSVAPSLSKGGCVT